MLQCFNVSSKWSRETAKLVASGHTAGQEVDLHRLKERLRKPGEREYVTAVLVCLCINYIAVLLKQTWAPDWLQPLQLLGLHLWCCLIWTLRPPADASDWLNPVLPLQSDSGVLLPSEALHQLQFSRLIKNNLFAVGNGVFVVSLINVSLSIHYSSFWCYLPWMLFWSLVMPSNRSAPRDKLLFVDTSTIWTSLDRLLT